MSKQARVYIELDNQKDLIKKLVDIFSATWIARENWLTSQEKEYFAECIILNAKGWNLLSPDTVDHFRKHPGFPDKSVYIYRDKIKKKKWIIQTKEGIKIHPEFNYVDGNIPTSFTLTIPLRVKQKSTSI